MNSSIPCKPGVYVIHNNNTGKFYIGSAVRLLKRKNDHFSELRKGTHGNSKLQNAWNKYGEMAFQFVIIEILEHLEDLIPFEDLWIKEFFPQGIMYNILPEAGSNLGMKASEETLEKLRIYHTGLVQSQETIAKRVAKTTGLKRTPETIEKLASANRGQKRTPEQCARISAAHIGVSNGPASEERKKKVGDALRGRKQEDWVIEQRKAIVQANWDAKKALGVDAMIALGSTSELLLKRFREFPDKEFKSADLLDITTTPLATALKTLLKYNAVENISRGVYRLQTISTNNHLTNSL